MPRISGLHFKAVQLPVPAAHGEHGTTTVDGVHSHAYGNEVAEVSRQGRGVCLGGPLEAGCGARWGSWATGEWRLEATLCGTTVSLGFTLEDKRIRRKVTGRTKQEVRDKLRALHRELDAGIRSSAGYTVRHAIEDWLRDALDGRSQRTLALYEGLLEPVLEIIGSRPLRELSRLTLVRRAGR